VKTPAKVPRAPWGGFGRAADMGSFFTGSVSCGVDVRNAPLLSGRDPGGL